MRVVVILLLATAGCMAVLAMSEAKALTGDPPTEAPTTGAEPPSGQVFNESKLVITHVVKTVEFEVDVIEDDDNDNGTETSTSYIQTNIQLLNPELLKKLVDSALYSSSEPPSNAEADNTTELTAPSPLPAD